MQVQLLFLLLSLVSYSQINLNLNISNEVGDILSGIDPNIWTFIVSPANMP